jgi:hypothetical protein
MKPPNDTVLSTVETAERLGMHQPNVVRVENRAFAKFVSNWAWFSLLKRVGMSDSEAQDMITGSSIKDMYRHKRLHKILDPYIIEADEMKFTIISN